MQNKKGDIIIWSITVVGLVALVAIISITCVDLLNGIHRDTGDTLKTAIKTEQKVDDLYKLLTEGDNVTGTAETEAGTISMHFKDDCRGSFVWTDTPVAGCIMVRYLQCNVCGAVVEKSAHLFGDIK